MMAPVGVSMRTITGFAVLFAFLWAGEAVAAAFRLPVPGNVLGMVLLAAALVTRLVRLEWVESVADALLDNLGLLFVPPGVGIMLHFDLIRREWPAIAIALVVSTLLVLAVTGATAQLLARDRPETGRNA